MPHYRSNICAYVALATLTLLLAFPVSLLAIESQQPEAAVSTADDAGAPESANEKSAAAGNPSRDTHRAGAFANQKVGARQFAILVILLSVLGVATRLLWRRHRRALAFADEAIVEQADVDQDMRSN